MKNKTKQNSSTPSISDMLETPYDIIRHSHLTEQSVFYLAPECHGRRCTQCYLAPTKGPTYPRSSPLTRLPMNKANPKTQFSLARLGEVHSFLGGSANQ